MGSFLPGSREFGLASLSAGWANSTAGYSPSSPENKVKVVRKYAKHKCFTPICSILQFAPALWSTRLPACLGSPLSVPGMPFPGLFPLPSSRLAVHRSATIVAGRSDMSTERSSSVTRIMPSRMLTSTSAIPGQSSRRRADFSGSPSTSIQMTRSTANFAREDLLRRPGQEVVHTQ